MAATHSVALLVRVSWPEKVSGPSTVTDVAVLSRKVTVPTTALSWARAARGAPAIRAVSAKTKKDWAAPPPMDAPKSFRKTVLIAYLISHP